MRGTIRIKVGNYQLSNAYLLGIRATDEGAAINIVHRPANILHTVTIDESGNIVNSQPARIVAPPDKSADRPATPVPRPARNDSRPAAQPAVVPEPPAPPMPSGRKTWKKTSQVKFVIKRGKRRNSAYVISGYTNGKEVYVMCRIGGNVTNANDSIVMLMPEDKILMDHQSLEYRLPDDQWEKFLRCRDGSTGLIGGEQCRKMSVDEIRPYVDFKTFEIFQPEAEIPDS